MVKLGSSVPAPLLLSYLATCDTLTLKHSMSDLPPYTLAAVIQAGSRFHALAVWQLCAVSALHPTLTLTEEGAIDMTPALHLAKAVLEYSISREDNLACLSEVMYYLHSVNLEGKPAIASLLTSADR